MLDCLQQHAVQTELGAESDQRLSFLLLVTLRNLEIGGLCDARGLAKVAGGFAVSCRVCAQLCRRCAFRPLSAAADINAFCFASASRSSRPSRSRASAAARWASACANLPVFRASAAACRNRETSDRLIGEPVQPVGQSFEFDGLGLQPFGDLSSVERVGQLAHVGQDRAKRIEGPPSACAVRRRSSSSCLLCASSFRLASSTPVAIREASPDTDGPLAKHLQCIEPFDQVIQFAIEPVNSVECGLPDVAPELVHGDVEGFPRLRVFCGSLMISAKAANTSSPKGRGGPPPIVGRPSSAMC